MSEPKKIYAKCPNCGFDLDEKAISSNTWAPVFWCCSCERWFVGPLEEIDETARAYYHVGGKLK